MSTEEIEKLAVTLEEEMFAAAEELRFEYAAKLRDEIRICGASCRPARRLPPSHCSLRPGNLPARALGMAHRRGAIVGALGRLLPSGRDPMGLDPDDPDRCPPR